MGIKNMPDPDANQKILVRLSTDGYLEAMFPTPMKELSFTVDPVAFNEEISNQSLPENWNLDVSGTSVRIYNPSGTSLNTLNDYVKLVYLGENNALQTKEIPINNWVFTGEAEKTYGVNQFVFFNQQYSEYQVKNSEANMLELKAELKGLEEKKIELINSGNNEEVKRI